MAVKVLCGCIKQEGKKGFDNGILPGRLYLDHRNLKGNHHSIGNLEEISIPLYYSFLFWARLSVQGNFSVSNIY